MRLNFSVTGLQKVILELCGRSGRKETLSLLDPMIKRYYQMILRHNYCNNCSTSLVHACTCMQMYCTHRIAFYVQKMMYKKMSIISYVMYTCVYMSNIQFCSACNTAYIVFHDFSLVALFQAILWNIRQCRYSRHLIGHTGAVFGVDLNEDCSHAFSCSGDKVVIM